MPASAAACATTAATLASFIALASPSVWPSDMYRRTTLSCASAARLHANNIHT
jgi:hypothetical protein